jgi:large subunit ribosomal protein L28
MSRTCQVTGKSRQVGHKVSHSNIKSKKRFEINLREKRFWLPEEKRWIHLRVSARGQREIDKRGLSAVLADIRARGEKI